MVRLADPLIRVRTSAGPWLRARGIDARLTTAAVGAALLAALIAVSGIAGQIDRTLSDSWFGASSRAPSGQIVIVDIARAARREGDALHLPRARLAELLGRLGAAGARKILIDLNLPGATTPAADGALEAALTALSPARVAVTATAVVSSDAGGAVHWARTDVFEPFTRHATLVCSDLAFDADGQLRRFGIEGTTLAPLLSGAAWLVGRPTTRPRRIDYSIDVADIPVVDAANVLDARLDLAQLAGRSVVIANNAGALGNQIRVPRFGALQRSAITALSAETVMRQKPMRSLNGVVVTLAAMLLAAFVAIWSVRLGLFLSTGAILGIALCTIAGAAQLQNQSGVIVPAATALLATLLGYGAAHAATHPRFIGLLAGNAQDHHLATVMDENGEALVSFEPDGTVLSMNAAARRIFTDVSNAGEISVTDLLGSQADELLSATRASCPGRLTAVIEGDKRRHLDLTVSTMRSGGTEWIGLASIRDVTDQQTQLEELKRLLVQDPLTGLVNRLGFDRALSEGCAGGHQRGNEMAVLMCDLDGFKEVDDRLGHQAGDVLLVEVAKRLRAAMTSDTVIGRLGGRRISINVRSDRISQADTARLVDTLASRIAAPIELGSGAVSVGISIGVALYPSQNCTPEGLMRIADAAMYRNKRSRDNPIGRSRVA